MKTGIFIYISALDESSSPELKDFLHSLEAAFLCCIMQDCRFFLVERIWVNPMLFNCLIVKQKLNDLGLVIHGCYMQTMISLVGGFIYLKLSNSLFLPLMKNLFNNLSVTFLGYMVKNSPSIAVLLVYIRSTFQ